ncbi:MAG: flavodoxin domain-containing protein, partial [Promethearchaeota archaeon]
MKIRIYYFSGTGNTEFVAKHIATEMKSSGQESIIKVIPITISTTISKSELAETDLIGIGYPIHAFNAPKIVYSFIEKLPAGSHKRVFIFRSAGDPILHSGGTTLVRSALFRKEFRVVYERLFIMPANVFVEFNPKLSKQLVDHCKIQA